MTKEQLYQQVAAKIFEGRKLEAVKLVKETLGVSLYDAKCYVEEVEMGKIPNYPMKDKNNPVSLLEVDGEKQEIIKLLQQNKKIEAIKYVRQVRKLGLKEAADYVDEIEISTGLNRDANLSESQTDMRTKIAFAILGLSIALGVLMWIFLLGD